MFNENQTVRPSKKLAVFVILWGFLLISVGISSCSPSQSAEKEDRQDAQTEVVASFTWASESDCSTCHSAEAESSENPLCGLYAHEELSCNECHTDSSALTAVHEEVALTDTNKATRLKQTSVSKSVCLECHEADYSAERTEGIAILTDSEGTTVNPHDFPNLESHEEITCSNCHTMHADEAIDVTASKFCLSCHHHDVYECYTCHE